MLSVRRFIRHTVRALHLESHPFVQRIRRYYPGPAEHIELKTMLDLHRVNVVLDVGANAGQFARSLRMAGFAQRIVSFEPNRIMHERLQKLAARDKQWMIAPPMAIGDRQDLVELHISGDTVSSSVAEMLPAHIEAEPDSRYVASEKVRLERLDTAAAGFLQDKDRIFLKIDVQGFEDQVLAGAPEILKNVVGIMVELCLVPCYEGQTLFEPALQRLTTSGFEIWTLYRGTKDQKTARLLQVDAVLFRS
jgi:FkbM family methyltransferase